MIGTFAAYFGVPSPYPGVLGVPYRRTQEYSEYPTAVPRSTRSTPQPYPGVLDKPSGVRVHAGCNARLGAGAVLRRTPTRRRHPDDGWAARD